MLFPIAPNVKTIKENHIMQQEVFIMDTYDIFVSVLRCMSFARQPTPAINIEEIL